MHIRRGYCRAGASDLCRQDVAIATTTSPATPPAFARNAGPKSQVRRADRIDLVMSIARRFVRGSCYGAFALTLVAWILSYQFIAWAPNSRIRLSLAAGMVLLEWVPNSFPTTQATDLASGRPLNSQSVVHWNLSRPDGSNPIMPSAVGFGCGFSRGEFVPMLVWRPRVSRVPYMGRICLPLWIPTLLFGVPPYLFLRDSRKRARWKRTGACWSCGYNLTCNTTGICPECGANAPVPGEAPPPTSVAK